METPGPPVDGGVVDEWVFVWKGGGEGSWFVSFRYLEDQALMAAVVVDLVPEYLKEYKNEWKADGLNNSKREEEVLDLK